MHLLYFILHTKNHLENYVCLCCYNFQNTFLLFCERQFFEMLFALTVGWQHCKVFNRKKL